MTPDGSRAERGQLVGRTRELSVVESALVRVSRGSTCWLALSGDPGVGKTRLLGELLDRAAARRHLVLGGHGAELERDMPFGIWVDALEDHVRLLGGQGLELLMGERADELVGVLPSVSAGRPPAQAMLQNERYRAHRAVRFLLERLAERRPVVVVLDDLHWADDASLELVAHLLRRPVQAPVLVALAFRSRQLPPWLAGPLDAAVRDGLASIVAMHPLSSSEADVLLGDGMSAAVRARLYALTGGNPFYLEQLAELAARDPGALLAAEDLPGVPDAVAAALGQQVAGLSDGARLLAWGAAVAGEPVDLDLAAGTAGIGAALARERVDELLRAQLLVTTDVACRYRFRHPIVRRAVHASAAESWRLQAHSRAAAVLVARGATMSARAHHVERCAAVGDDSAIAVLVAAGHEAASRAPAGAARWFEAALRLTAHDESAAPRRLELLILLATARVSAGDLERGLAAFLEALDLSPSELGFVRVRLVGACACCENLLGRHHAAHARLLRALDELPAHDSVDATALQVELAADAIFETDFVAALGWAQQARVTARALDEPNLSAVSAALACFAGYTLADPALAEGARVEAMTAFDALSDEALAGRLDAPYYLGYAEYFCEHFDDAIRHLERGIAVSRAFGQGQFLVPMMVGLAFALEVRGRLAEALETAVSAVEAARLAGNRQITSWALLAEAWTAAMHGRAEQAIRAGTEALAGMEGLDESVLTRANRETVAAAFIEAGDPQRGLEQAQLAGAPDFPHVDRGRRTWLYGLLAQAELTLGRPGPAEAWLVRGERSADGLELPLRTAGLLHSRALLQLEERRPKYAAATARRAISSAQSVGAVIQAARSRTLLGTALARAGRREEAITLLREAEAQLASYGAQRLRGEAARELRRLGRRPAARQRRGAGGEGLDALSGREREIAELVAHGHTNRRIAALLYLSDKTVEGHLTNVFAKLGVASRAEVAERVGRARCATRS